MENLLNSQQAGEIITSTLNPEVCMFEKLESIQWVLKQALTHSGEDMVLEDLQKEHVANVFDVMAAFTKIGKELAITKTDALKKAA